MITLSEYCSRRQHLLEQVNNNSLVIIDAASEKVRSNDTDYPFRQNSDFFYLTGFNEPEAILILIKHDSQTSESIAFVRKKDQLAEIWHGRRLGAERAPEELGVDKAYELARLDSLLPELLNQRQHVYATRSLISGTHSSLQKAMTVCHSSPKQSLVAPASIVDISDVIHQMRLIKSSAELALMQKSADISCEAHSRAMRVCKAGMFEYQLEAHILHEFAMHGARYPAYNTIVGSGQNACILHYTENSDELKNGDLVLIDAGSEYCGYAADITRTFPVSGTFSQAQAELYQLVLDAQLASLELLKPGSTLTTATNEAVKVIVNGLIELGILSGSVEDNIESKTYRQFFMHGLGHYLGLDVHDVGKYKNNGEDIPLQVGTVLTVEPGIYIDEAADVPAQYCGIGIRIEDNIVITEHGNEVLTNDVPKTISDIECLMASNYS